ncbi:MAG: N-acetyltransferase [Dehalococcoidia bacterium]|nr:N-acetyltransferase [Dehalococcoidia bacterium]
MATGADATIRKNEDKRRFEVMVDGQEAYLTFADDSTRLWLLHTFVPPPLEGRGIAGRLAKHGLEYARENGLAVVPLRPYVLACIERHPDYQDLVE